MKKTFDWPGRVYITSDLHIGDQDVLSMERSSMFSTLEEEKEYIFKLLKRTATVGNTLVILGDLGTDEKGWQGILARLKCYKVLVVGNHDTKSRDYYKQFFDEVYLTEIPATDIVTFSHQPVIVSPHKINVHGHLHNANLSLSNYINASIYMAGMKLLDLEDIDRQARQIKYDKNSVGPRALFRREWYSNFYDFKEGK